MKVVAIVQARMGSARLPGKVLKDICGTTLIERVIERTLASSTVKTLVVATTEHESDNQLVEFLQRRQVQVFRGPVDDVLARYYGAADHHHADVVVRVTADDPLKDPGVIDRVTERLLIDPQLHYASNTLRPTYPEGLDIEVFRFQALESAHHHASLKSEREHVTPYIYKNPQLYKVANVEADEDLSAWRWTVDEARDLEFMRKVFGHFHSEPLVGWRTVVGWLKNRPDVVSINSDIRRNAGYEKSLKNDEAVRE